MSVLFAVCLFELALTTDPTGAIVATVQGEPILAAEVDRVLRESLGGREISDFARPALVAQALWQVIDQRLIAAFLDRQRLGAKPHEIDAALQAYRSSAQREQISWDEFLKQRALTEPALRREIAWRIGWKAYLAKELTDEILQKQFADNPREFDGTQLSVRHILWQSKESPGQVASDALQTARQVRQQLLDGRMTFAAAAAKHSSGPSRAQGGDLGYISRRGQMDEEFSRAAFTLQKDEISEPVLTRFGVHLIQWVDVRPGQIQWTEVKPQLRQAATRRLFETLAQQERAGAKIEFTGFGAYFKAGTGELVLPKAP